MSGDIIPYRRPSTREQINVDGVTCADQIDKLRDALGMHRLYIDSDTRRVVRVDTSANTPQLVQVTHATMTEVAARAYDWTRPGKSNTKQVAPPGPVVSAVLADPGDLPRLRRIVDVPYLAPTGRVVYRDGYDSETETYLRLDREIDPIPDRPSDEQLAAAVQVVAHNMLSGWQFADAASRANAIAAGITPAIQTLYPELLTPIFLVDAPDNNYGKTHLAQTLVAPLVGRSPDVTPMTMTDRTECRRTLYSLLRGKPAALILDNIASPLAGDAIAAIKTAKRVKDRVIKSSSAPTAEDTALWLATGTLMTCSREMALRSVLTQLVAPPTGNRDPILWAVDHRVEVICAHLVIMRRWIADGRRVDASVKHPKYPRWAELIGGVLQTMGIGDLLANQQALATRDDESRAWIDLVERWAALKGGPTQHRRVTDILNDAVIAGEPAYDIVADGRDHDARKKILGHALRRREGIAVGTWRIRAVENKHHKVHEYWLEPVAPPTVASPPVAPATTPPTPSAPRAPKNPASKNPATTPQGSSVGSSTGKEPECGVCGVSYPHNTSHTCARAPARDAPTGSTIPANPAAGSPAVAPAIDSWATAADAGAALDNTGILARAVARERRGGRS